jgi:iron(II)-dependent oxidoreductase
MIGQTAAAREADTEELVDALEETRSRTLGLVASVSEADVDRVHSPLMSPLAWDLGHVAAYEDLWLAHRYGGRPILRDELMDVYDAFETPRAERGDLPFLRGDEARRYMEDVRERTLSVLAERGAGDGFIAELVIHHEQQHCETMLQTIQLARLDGYRLPTGGGSAAGTGMPAGAGASEAGDHRNGAISADLDLIEIPAGPCDIGAVPERFAYDNERPRHRIVLDAFRIGRTPVTNASYLSFVEGGGYVRREWWSDEGWAWKEEYDITRPAAWAEGLDGEWRVDGFAPLDPERPVVHVSWFEAEAFARAHGARLPTEVEWEKAATWDRETGTSRVRPWGEEPLIPGLHANVDHVATGPLPARFSTAGTAASGCVAMIGDVWEWTSSDFTGYPGFVARPYPEYSEVFFGSGYRVLRGGSWATRARVISPAFRNWDFPQRRQIFAGFRIATDA